MAEEPGQLDLQRAQPRDQQAARSLLARPIADLELSVRARNCLDGANIQTLRDLVTLSENEVMNLKNLGKTSLTEIKAKLAERGLGLGHDSATARRCRQIPGRPDQPCDTAVAGNKLGRTSSHRNAMIRNMAAR